MGSRTRPKAIKNQQTQNTIDLEEVQENSTGGDTNIKQEPPREPTLVLKMDYPSKRFKEREQFLKNWNDTFSKQWDDCCEWSFKNSLKMYGSLQFESVLQADKKIHKEFEQTKPHNFEKMPYDEKRKLTFERFKKHMDNRLEYFDSITSKLLEYKHNN